jgi:hypothetical protein
MAQRIAQVRVRARDPGPRVRKLRIVEVPGGELGTRRSPMTHIEVDDGVGNLLAAERRRATHHLHRQIAVPETFDLERQKRQLLEGIEEPKVPIELDAIDHAERRTEAHVLGTQVAVPLDDT